VEIGSPLVLRARGYRPLADTPAQSRYWLRQYASLKRLQNKPHGDIYPQAVEIILEIYVVLRNMPAAFAQNDFNCASYIRFLKQRDAA